ncbi:hypothetical protein Ddc_15192 [Ditylenchus destructor]|nr:hypothetical protein Ddc_15192 [Ditylenchus destructor]
MPWFVDDHTLEQTFKFLGYFQLAKSSLVSRRFSRVIQSNRSRLAKLRVKKLLMDRRIRIHQNFITVCDVEFNPNEYREWAYPYGYTKGYRFDSPVVAVTAAYDSRSPERREQHHSFIRLQALAYEDSNTLVTVFSAVTSTKLSYDNWPLYQHFIRLLNDPFAYFERLTLISFQNFAWNALVENYGSRNRSVTCKYAKILLEDDSKDFLVWIKQNVVSEDLSLRRYETSTYDQDDTVSFLSTGQKCASSVVLRDEVYNGEHLIGAIYDLIEKFLDLETSIQCQMISSINFRHICNLSERFLTNFARAFVRDEIVEDSFSRIYQFMNRNIKKKLEVKIEIVNIIDPHSTIDHCFMNLENL